MNNHKEFDYYRQDGVEYTLMHDITSAEHRYLVEFRAQYEPRLESAIAAVQYWKARYEELTEMLAANGVQPVESEELEESDPE